MKKLSLFVLVFTLVLASVLLSSCAERADWMQSSPEGAESAV